MPRSNKRKAAHKQVSRDKRGKFIKEDELNLMDTESSTFELIETGLSDDSSGENFPKISLRIKFYWYWGAAKRFARNNCNYTWSGLQETVPRALDSVNLITIRRFARKMWRYMDLYRHGFTGKLAEYAARKYKSHRRIPENAWEELRTN